jgi:hypothetical protein
MKFFPRLPSSGIISLWIVLHLAGPISFSQSLVKGRVVDGGTNKPISFADIYLVSTTFGAGSDMNGNFSFKVSKPGKYDLIASFVGYTKSRTSILVGKDSTFSFEFKLFENADELRDIVIQADTSHRKKDFKDFKRVFLGETENSSSSEILNPKEIYVYREETDQKLVAFARKVIVTENRGLGYTVYYDLENFESVGNKSSFTGSVRFKELSPKDEKQRARWKSAREISYGGSLTHLMSSIRSNRLEKEGWEVLIEYAKLRPSNGVISNRIQYHTQQNNADSVELYRYMRRLPANARVLSKPIFGKDLMDPNDKSLLVFKGKLLVTYNKERDMRLRPNLNKSAPYPFQLSIVKLSGKPITIYENGYFEPQEFVYIEGYLGFAERVSEFLPFDYRPESK